MNSEDSIVRLVYEEARVIEKTSQREAHIDSRLGPEHPMRETLLRMTKSEHTSDGNQSVDFDGGLGLVPEYVGRFKVLELLGQGTMGVVFRAIDETANPPEVVALKLLHPRFSDERATSRLHHEAIFLSKLDDRRIARFVGSGTTPVPFVAMEFIEGTPLAKPNHIRMWSLEKRISHATTILADIAEALAVAHRKGVLHRDLKPDNIIVRPDGSPVLVDFGVGHWSPGSLTKLTQTGEINGTPRYMSPEQFDSRKLIDERSDIWALGVIYYFLLSGKAPFDGTTIDEVRDQVRMKTPAKIVVNGERLPRNVETVLSVALSKLPNRRYQSASMLAEDLRRLEREEKISAKPLGLVAHVQQWIVFNPRALIALLAASAILCAIVLFLFNQKQEIARRSRLGDAPVIRELLAEASSMWPRRTSAFDAMQDWRRRAHEISKRKGQHLEDLNSTSSGSEESTLRGILALQNSLASKIAEVDERIVFASTLEQLKNTEHAAAWKHSIAAISTSEMYNGLRLTPQIGLLPLGENAETGLWEFWAIETGSRPSWVSGAAKLRGNRDGIVLVLVPGGVFSLGAQSELKSKNGFHPRAGVRTDGPMASTAVRPYFVSKFETTQGQWLNMTNSNPSLEYAGRHRWQLSSLDRAITELHPVESVSWEEVTRVCWKHGLRLPNEAEWELPVRRSFVLNSPVNALKGQENLLDASFVEGTDKGFFDSVPWDDSYIVHSPVGSFVGNRWGIHDMLGNVSEWVSDSYDVRQRHPLSDERVLQNFAKYRVMKGRHYGATAANARASYRNRSPERSFSHTLGFRTARSIAP